MTNKEFDQRIDKLTERHEALVQPVALLIDVVASIARSVDNLTSLTSIERHEELAESIEPLTDSVRELTAAANTLALDTKERRQRDQQYLLALASLLKSWSGDADIKIDEVKSALEAGDFPRYREAANRREIKRRRGRTHDKD